LRNRYRIGDETLVCEPKGYFYEKIGASYATSAVQFSPASSRTGTILSFS
jgi:hypothetical protein